MSTATQIQQFFMPMPMPAQKGNAIMPNTPAAALLDFLRRYERLFVLTGAGCSTASGIPDYRDSDGQWKHRRPVQYADFIGSPLSRQRYWLRSLVGWPRFGQAAPNAAHTALAELEQRGRVLQLVTQNVDGLHQQAGSRRVIDLHGRLDAVDCLGCGRRWPRVAMQDWLLTANPAYAQLDALSAPDGDAHLENIDFASVRVPDCPDCGGMLKPAVVFFGESVPKARVERAYARLAEAEALLVVGSSLMVYSGYRYCRRAREFGLPIAALNLGRTRADAELTLKVSASCTELLPDVVAALSLP